MNMVYHDPKKLTIGDLLVNDVFRYSGGDSQFVVKYKPNGKETQVQVRDKQKTFWESNNKEVYCIGFLR